MWNVHNLFPIPLFETTLNEDLISKEIKFIMSKIKNPDEFHSNQENLASNQACILDQWNLKEIKKSILNSVEIFTHEVLGYEYDNIYITQSWINVNPPGASHHEHNHCNSILSGIFYINVSKDCGDVIFYRPQRELVPNIKFNQKNYFTWENIYFTPYNNQLLIFPSTLMHSVSKNQDLHLDRVSLSFNVFMTPLGLPSHKTYLSLP